MSRKEDYIRVVFSDINDEETDVVIAFLADAGFEGFEEDANMLSAYISVNEYEKERVKEIAAQFNLAHRTEKVPAQNWNAVWESHFEPVVIDDFVAVRADFHEPIITVQHEIVITPKMSFGTGHHATTTMMIQQMRTLDFVGKGVFDFGTGTGILSILAEKLGAASVLAVDNDEWSIENSRENIKRNHCRQIEIELRNDANVNCSFDIILANINRNVILENFLSLFSQLKDGGYLVLSGLLAEDEAAIREEANYFELTYMNTLYQQQWISLLFRPLKFW